VEDGSVLPFVVSLREINDRSFEDYERTVVNLSLSFSKLFTTGQLL
jgi:hypothetical protein